MPNIVLFNKPFNVLCQFTDKDGRATLADYINHKGIYAAGRLDYDSEGLLLLTDDGKLQKSVTDPRSKLEKTYWAQVEGTVTQSHLNQLRQGVRLKDGITRPAKATIIAPPDIWPRNPPIRVRQKIPTSWIELKISEGRNRQVRRMTAHVGLPTLRLIRVAIGQWHIENLQPGESRQEFVTLPKTKDTQQRASNSTKRTAKRSGNRNSSPNQRTKKFVVGNSSAEKARPAKKQTQKHR